MSAVVLVSPRGREVTLSPEDVAAGRLADLQGQGYKKVVAPPAQPASRPAPAPVVSPVSVEDKSDDE